LFTPAIPLAHAFSTSATQLSELDVNKSDIKTNLSDGGKIL